MGNRRHVNIRDWIDGPIIGILEGISSDTSARSLHRNLTRAGIHNLTVLIRSQKKAGQVLSGYHKEGLYCTWTANPLDKPPGNHGP